MTYRTKTYIAAEWDTDHDAVEQLRKWNDSNYWVLSFSDAHDLTSARDDSLNCSIKKSLKSRLDASKRFVLIVGGKTDSVASGSCQHCGSYNSCSVSRWLCPEALRYVGVHSPMGKRHDDGNCYFDYATVKDAFDKSDRE